MTHHGLMHSATSPLLALLNGRFDAADAAASDYHRATRRLQALDAKNGEQRRWQTAAARVDACRRAMYAGDAARAPYLELALGRGA